MSIPPQASFSSVTTAVASRGTAYPSVEKLASFKLPSKPSMDEPTCDKVSDHSNESDPIRQLAPHPSTPTPASPVSTETSDRDFNLEDTPSTIHGESMLYPRHPLAARAPSINFPVSPHWPFQDATPRPSVMVPVAQSITGSSRAFHLSTRNSPIGQVSVSESLDEFQVNHPNAHLLSLHPRPLTYRQVTRNLTKIPELVEKPQRDIQSKQGVPMTYNEKPINAPHCHRLSRRIGKPNLRRHPEKRTITAKPKTFWYQRISVDTKIFRGSATITMFFLVNSFVSTSALITLVTARLDVPRGIVVWVIVSLSTCAFTLMILYLMRKFRNAVPFDDENRGCPPLPKQPLEASMSHMQLPASPSEIYHRRQLGAAVEQETSHPEQTTNELVKRPHGPEVNQVTQSSPISQIFNPLGPLSPREAIDNYWTDNFFISSADSEASSRTAVITSTSKALRNNPEFGLVGAAQQIRGERRAQRHAENNFSVLECAQWDGWLEWD
ncbi:hypothetical protein CI238_04190 [Colletotrichum incanum]|uniref:Uncharacterized protein n=1 Tax=Colletotrichum incanum TaxID=1573173 RepID=A0A161WE36_COLIC|nr:hypothetical protein CI238_04190 [Colletotrichum incanum]OHW98037.1 hypothetical protein CSPAE12_03410 [Colletotrichum incanum]